MEGWGKHFDPEVVDAFAAMTDEFGDMHSVTRTERLLRHRRLCGR